MILFENDWELYPDAVVDQNTSNTSFLRLAEIYSKMGIKNCDFHLTTLNPNIIGLDPHSPDLTESQQIMIFDECINNFWYYIREVHTLDLQGSAKGINFRANRSNIGLFWLYFNHITTINTVIRQTGKTTNLVALIQWLLNFAVRKYTIGMITKNSGLRAETMREIKQQFDKLPPYMDMRTKKDTFNSEDIILQTTQNNLHCALSNMSGEEADKVLRGYRIATLLVDEIAFVNNIARALSAASMAGNRAKEVARELGNPYGSLYVTTAGDIDSRDGNYVYELLNKSCVYNERMLDCTDIDELKHYVITNSSTRDAKERKIMVNLTMTYRQMGYDDAWMDRKLEETTSDDENIERDLFNKWISGSSASPLTAQNKEDLEAGRRDVLPEIYDPYGYAIRWYVSEAEMQRITDKGGSFIIGVDTSDAAGGDDVSFYIRNSLNGEIIAGALFNDISLFNLGDFFSDFLIKHDNAVMVMERKSSASTIIDIMISRLCAAGINPFTRIFNTIVQNKDKHEKEFKEIMTARVSDKRTFIKYKSHLGFTTVGNGEFARSGLYGHVMKSALKYTAHLCHDIPLIQQYMGLIIKNGRIDHQQGSHDDAVFASLLNYWFLMLGKNLNVYGVNTSSILRTNDEYIEDKYQAVKDNYDRKEMEERELEIAELLETMKECDNDILATQLEKRITFLYRDVVRDSNQVSLEEYFESIRNERRMRYVRR